MRPDLPQTLKRFWRSRRGVAAVEFALLVPMLLVAYLGATDLTQGLAIDRKLGQLSATVGDLVARETAITEPTVLAFFDTGSAIMRPFDFNNTRLLLTVVKVEGGSAEITAVAEHNWPTTLKKGDSYPLPAETMAVANGRHVVITNAGYTFTPLFSTVFDGSMQLAQSSTNVLRNDVDGNFGF